MNKKIILILSVMTSAVLLTTVWITFAQPARDSQIPTEWYETYPSPVITEMWRWDWTGYTTEVPWPGSYMLYKRVGETVFFTLYPTAPVMVAFRAGQSSTFVWRGGMKAMGGPYMAHLMMFNGTVSITFTNEDIPLTDDDNNYKGMRLVAEMSGDLFGLEDVGGDDYLWHGLAHQHIVLWAPKGSRV